MQIAMQGIPMKVDVSDFFSGPPGDFRFNSRPEWRNAPMDPRVAHNSARVFAGIAPLRAGIGPPPGLTREDDHQPRSRGDSSQLSLFGGDATGTASEVSTSEVAASAQAEERTTLHVRNLPCSLKRGDLLRVVNSLGLAEQVDFVYLPMDFKSKQSIGYAFMNFRSSSAALIFRDAMHGFAQWRIPSQKVCSVDWSQTQGYEANVRLIIKSRVMQKSIPAHFKPVVLMQGQIVQFPKVVHAPKRLEAEGLP